MRGISVTHIGRVEQSHIIASEYIACLVSTESLECINNTNLHIWEHQGLWVLQQRVELIKFNLSSIFIIISEGVNCYNKLIFANLENNNNINTTPTILNHNSTNNSSRIIHQKV